MQEHVSERLSKGRMLQQKEPNTPGPLHRLLLFHYMRGNINLAVLCYILCYTLFLFRPHRRQKKKNPASMVISYSETHSGAANCSWPYVWQLEDFLTKQELSWPSKMPTHHWRVLTTETWHFTFTEITCLDWQDQDVWNPFNTFANFWMLSTTE